MSQFPSSGTPGVGATTLVLSYRTMFDVLPTAGDFIPGGRLCDGANTRDPDNTVRTDEIRSGLTFGRITATQLLAAAIIGLSTVVLTPAGTTLTTTPQGATELARRVGTSGTLALSAFFEPLAAVNQIEAMVVTDSSGVGTFTMTIEGVTTGAITYSATIATLITNINTALNTTFGTSAIVASGASLAALVVTFSGQGFAGRLINGHVTSTITIASGSYTINGSTTIGTSTTSTAGNAALPAGVRVKPVAFSAVNTTTGAITITALSSGAVAAVNQIEALVVVDNTGVGTFTLTIEGITTAAITYNATAATLVSNINTALNTAFGVGAIVASGSTLAAIILTFSGIGYAGRPIVGHAVSTITQVGSTFTINGSATSGTSTTTIAGVTAVAADTTSVVAPGSWIGANDGSAVPITFYVGPDPIRVTDVNSVSLAAVEIALIPRTSKPVRVVNLINYNSSNLPMAAYLKSSLRVVVPGMQFSDDI